MGKTPSKIPICALSLILLLMGALGPIGAQERYNHPELVWLSFETAHFKIHYHEGAEWTARETAQIAEAIYGPVTSLYDYEPDAKTHLYIKDYDDFSNGITYYYDNKIELWATPLDFLLRGNHSWLHDVITHEFTHIVTLQKAMKLPRSIPAAYFQVIDYEDEKRDDVVYGYPRVIASYPIPGIIMPMWLAEGVAQYQFPRGNYDFWDSHRDMLLRDRILQDQLLSLSEMGSFGKRGIGNETVYNQGYALVRYIADRFGEEALEEIIDILSAPFQVSVNTALQKVTGVNGQQIYDDWKKHLTADYSHKLEAIQAHEQSGDVFLSGGTTQIYPEWSGDTLVYFLSNEGRDYFGQTSLYRYHLPSGQKKLIRRQVHSRICVAPDGNTLYYSRRSKPNKHGSVYYDIYRYDLAKKKEEPVTKYRRAYHPSLSPDGKRIVFITGRDGTSNLVLYDLESKEEQLLTEFDQGLELFSIDWSPEGDRIAYDYMTEHGRDIGLYDFSTGEIQNFDHTAIDTRNPYFGPHGQWLYYASDETGIYNIYRRSLDDAHTELLTNVTGGAFMPAVNEEGTLVYCLFEKSAYQIARIPDLEPLDPQFSTYFEAGMQVPEFIPVTQIDLPEARPYRDQFAKVFVLPKLMVDYGTLKPGFYFYSSEILDRFNIFGSASLNGIGDRDLALLLEYHQWAPTIFLEFYSISRNILDQQIQWKGYPIETDYTFYLTEVLAGLSRPIDGMNRLRLDIGAAKYRTSTSERIESQGIYSNGFTYDYYRGSYVKLNWQCKKMLPGVNSEMNPNNGWSLSTDISRNFDHFMQDFGVYEDFGTLKEIFRKNYYWKLSHEGNLYHKIPLMEKMVGNLKWRMGWISMPDVDSFFNFFAGGLPGLRGYPFYSIEGRNLLSLHYTVRKPVFVEKDIPLGIFHLQNAFVGMYWESGNAWSSVDGFPRLHWKEFFDNPGGITQTVLEDFKTDIGLQLRFSGFSFYAYPTAISLDFVYGFDKFTVMDRQDNPHQYGQEWRTYLTILFGL